MGELRPLRPEDAPRVVTPTRVGLSGAVAAGVATAVVANNPQWGPWAQVIADAVALALGWLG